MSERRVIARLQALCCLGLGGPGAIPAVLAELHSLVGSGSNDFVWAGPNLEMAQVYGDSELYDNAAAGYFRDYYGQPRERKLILSFRELMQIPFASPVDDFFHRMLKVPFDELRRTEAYNRLRLYGAERRLQIKLVENGRPLGVLHVNRELRSREFSARDRRVLEEIAPFIAHALASGPPHPGLPTETEDRAVVIARADGRIEDLSRGAERLIRLASEPQDWGHANWSKPYSLPGPVAALCRCLAANFEGRPQTSAPVWQRVNPWGKFTFRAFPMSGNWQAADAARFSVTIEREVPLPVRLLARIGRLGLSPREEQFCILASAGCGRNEIAERLNIAVNTAITHARSIYAKLGVQDRTELIHRLRAL